MDYKEILQRYYSGEATLDEERALREHLRESKSTTSADRMAAHSMMEYAAEARQERAYIRLHQPSPRRVWSIASALALCVIIVVGGIKLSQPTIYGYHNGKPITTIEEARYYGEQMFAELSIADYAADNKDLLKEIFKLE